MKTEQQRDDEAVAAFAAIMKAKLDKSREKGRSGWRDCSPADLSRMFHDHVAKGDPVDVANFAMMLLFNGGAILQAATRDALDDTARLDFMLANDAFTVLCNRDGSIKKYQLMTQDEDENYHVLHNEQRFYNAERDAIDAAIAASAPKGDGND